MKHVDKAFSNYVLNIEHAILIFDDLMNEITKSNNMLSLFGRAYPHKDCCIFNLWQVLFMGQKWPPLSDTRIPITIFYSNESAQEVRNLIRKEYPTHIKEIWPTVMAFIKDHINKRPYILCAHPKDKQKDVL